MMRSILKRKGLTKYLLDAVLAIGGLLMLIFLGVKLYNFFVSQDEKNAAAFLDGLKAKIEALEEGEVGNFVLRGVEGWSLAGWSREDSLKVKPQKCFDVSCLCACPSTGDIASSCQEDGLCRKVDFNRVQFSTAEGVIDSGRIKDLSNDLSDKIDATFVWYAFEIYVLSGENYYLFSRDNVKFVLREKGLISSKWSGIPSDIDAVIRGYRQQNDIIYFFKGNQYWKFDGQKNQIVSGPVSISQWPGIPESLDAGVSVYSSGGATYFFKGNQYWKYIDSSDALAEGYPRLISENWKGIPNDVDGAFESFGDIYFFKQDKYYIYRYLGFAPGGALFPTEPLSAVSVIPLKKKLAEFGVRKKDGNLFISDKTLPIPQTPQA